MTAAGGSGGVKLSVVVVIHEMRREAPRTLHSLSAAYQRDIAAEEYEVIVVENGSRAPVAPETVCGFGANFIYHALADAPPSPVRAINRGVELARGRHVGLMLDGARLVTPGALAAALRCLEGPRPAVVGTVGFHLGSEPQIHSVASGYDAAAEDRLLAGIDWPQNGYRLFEIAALAGSSKNGWFGPLAESNLLFMPRASFAALGGYDERFDLPGGGLANLDLYDRATRLPETDLITLLGEATFHQVHGGVTTNVSEPEMVELWHLYNRQYQRLHGRPFSEPRRRPRFFGEVRPEFVPWMAKSLELMGGG
jgi:hypothetical protein